MRRMMYRIMERLCYKYKAYAIINGESIGQVASQTLVSMNTINSVTSIPVIRPVACLDKLEIIDIIPFSSNSIPQNNICGTSKIGIYVIAVDASCANDDTNNPIVDDENIVRIIIIHISVVQLYITPSVGTSIVNFNVNINNDD